MHTKPSHKGPGVGWGNDTFLCDYMAKLYHILACSQFHEGRESFSGLLAIPVPGTRDVSTPLGSSCQLVQRNPPNTQYRDCDCPSTCCHHRAKPLLEDTAPRPFMRPISFQASRSQEEHSTTFPA